MQPPVFTRIQNASVWSNPLIVVHAGLPKTGTTSFQAITATMDFVSSKAHAGPDALSYNHEELMRFVEDHEKNVFERLRTSSLGGHWHGWISLSTQWHAKYLLCTLSRGSFSYFGMRGGGHRAQAFPPR